jgi:ornithine cyclodeaminase/alanine dehydrogenase-like protein (mu-crystallin family)
VDAGTVHRVLDPDTARLAVEAAFRASTSPGATPPVTAGLHAPAGTFHVKSAIETPSSGQRRHFVAKINANFPGNTGRHGLPTIQGLLTLFDADRGTPLAIMDSGAITVIRTAAATAVAVQHLALPDATRMTIIGCGAQAESQCAAVLRVRPVSEVVVHDLDGAAARWMAERLRATHGIGVRVAATIGEATQDSGIIVTATTATTAFLLRGHLAPGCFVAAVGADNPRKHEVDPDLMASAVVVTDQTAQCAKDGDLHHAIEAGVMTADAVRAELGAVVADIAAGRRSPDEIIVFDSTGLAFQDVAVATVVHDALRLDSSTPAFNFASSTS